MNTEVFTCVGRSGWTYRVSQVEPKQWNEEAIQLWVRSSLQSQEQSSSFSTPIMLSAPETHPILSVDPTSHSTEDTVVVHNLIPMRPSTLLPGDSAAIDLTPSHNPPAYALTSPPSHDEKLAADIAYHSSPNQIDFWDCALQDSCQMGNGGLHAREYHPIQAVSPYRMHIPTSHGA